MTEEKVVAMKKLTFKQKCSHIWKNTTVEPLLACYIIPSVLVGMADQNVFLEKACRVNLAYGDAVCDALTRRETANYTVEERKVQQLVAGMAGWKSVISSLLPSLLILFWGSWSDRHGRRKPCMLIPLIGELVQTFGMILCAYFKSVPMQVAGLVGSIPVALAGGWVTMMMAVFSYIADVTTEEDRTFRIGVLNMCFTLGIPIGLALSGVMLKYLGFYAMYLVCDVLYLTSFLYGVFVLKEPVRKVVTKNDGQVQAKTIQKNIIVDFFDWKHIAATFKVAFKKGANKRRLRVVMLMIVVMVVIGPMHGEMALIYLFTRYRFNWSEVEFSFFSTYSTVINGVGTLFSVSVFSHILKIDDALIGVMSSMSKILSSFVYAFAVTEWQFFFAPIAEIVNGTSFIAMRSIASKLVSKDELAKVNSLFGVAEGLMPLFYVPMYTTLYSFTINTLPGAFFLLGAALTIPAVVIFFWMYGLHKEDEKRKMLEAYNVNTRTSNENVDSGTTLIVGDRTSKNDKDIEMNEQNRLLNDRADIEKDLSN